MSLESNYLFSTASSVSAYRGAKKLFDSLCLKYPKQLILQQLQYEERSGELPSQWEKMREVKMHNFETKVFPSLMSQKCNPNSNTFTCMFEECMRTQFTQRNALVRHLIQFHYDEIPGGGLILLQNPGSFDRFMCKWCSGHFKNHQLYKSHKVECKHLAESFLRPSETCASAEHGETCRKSDEMRNSSTRMPPTEIEWIDDWILFAPAVCSTQETSGVVDVDEVSFSALPNIACREDRLVCAQLGESNNKRKRKRLSSSSSVCLVERKVSKQTKSAADPTKSRCTSDDDDAELLRFLASSIGDEGKACTSAAATQANISSREATSTPPNSQHRIVQQMKRHLSDDKRVQSNKRAKYVAADSFSADDEVFYGEEECKQKDEDDELLLFLARLP